MLLIASKQVAVTTVEISLATFLPLHLKNMFRLRILAPITAMTYKASPFSVSRFLSEQIFISVSPLLPVPFTTSVFELEEGLAVQPGVRPLPMQQLQLLPTLLNLLDKVVVCVTLVDVVAIQNFETIVEGFYSNGTFWD